MNILSDFTDFIYQTNTPGSDKAGSYIRALKYLNIMLRECSPEWKNLGDVFEVLRGEQNGNTSGEQNGTPCKPMDPCKHWL